MLLPGLVTATGTGTCSSDGKARVAKRTLCECDVLQTNFPSVPPLPRSS